MSSALGKYQSKYTNRWEKTFLKGSYFSHIDLLSIFVFIFWWFMYYNNPHIDDNSKKDEGKILNLE